MTNQEEYMKAAAQSSKIAKRAVAEVKEPEVKTSNHSRMYAPKKATP